VSRSRDRIAAIADITSLKKSVEEDVDFLKNSPYIKKDIKVHGYVFDLLDKGILIPV
jgi:carbonic anhydrase